MHEKKCPSLIDYGVIDYDEGGVLPGISRQVQEVFERDRQGLLAMKTVAAEVSSLIREIDPVIQKETEAVCPECRDVCCINRHSRYAFDDIIYISALGKRMLPYKRGIPETSPCQFLGERGCLLDRGLRPYRCNWYFCSPLLERMQAAPAREYRRFSELLRKITEKRGELLAVYAGLQAD